MTAAAIEALTQRMVALEQLNRIQSVTINGLHEEVRGLARRLNEQRPNTWPALPMYPSPVTAPNVWPPHIWCACDPVYPGLHKAIQG